MQRNNRFYYILAAVLLLLVAYVGVSYNGFVKKKARIEFTQAELDATYQRRLDLIPSLVNTVKGMSGFEQSTLEQIATARANALKGLTTTSTAGEKQELQNQVAIPVNILIISIERYPTLKGTSAYKALQTQIEGTERRIKFARNDFTDAVTAYNVGVRSFPSSMVAAIFGYKAMEGFKAQDGADKAVEIKFNN